MEISLSVVFIYVFVSDELEQLKVVIFHGMYVKFDTDSTEMYRFVLLKSVINLLFCSFIAVPYLATAKRQDWLLSNGSFLECIWKYEE